MVINGSMVVAKQWKIMFNVQSLIILNWVSGCFGVITLYLYHYSLRQMTNAWKIRDRDVIKYIPKLGILASMAYPTRNIESQTWQIAGALTHLGFVFIYLLLYHESIWIVYVQLHGFSLLNTPKNLAAWIPPSFFVVENSRKFLKFQFQYPLNLW